MGGYGVAVHDRKALAKAMQDGLAADTFTVIAAEIGHKAYDGRF